MEKISPIKVSKGFPEIPKEYLDSMVNEMLDIAMNTGEPERRLKAADFIKKIMHTPIPWATIEYKTNS